MPLLESEAVAGCETAVGCCLQRSDREVGREMENDRVRAPLVFLVILGLAAIACSTTDLAREMLGRLAPTATPSSARGGAAVWYVAVDGDDDNACNEVAAPCQTVQAAIEKAGDGDNISIEAGTYRERAPRSAAGLWIEGKTLFLRGAGVDATVLEPRFPAHTAVVIRGATAGISNLTIQNAREETVEGLRAINADLRLSDVVIQDNRGWGLLLTDSRSTFEFTNLTVQRNGGGVSLEGDGTITGSHIVANRGTGIENGSILTVSESSIERNRGPNGGGIRNNAAGQLTLDRSIVAHNTATAASFGIALGIRNDGTLTLINSTVSNNDPVSGGSGDAIVSTGDLELIHSTIAANDGGGLHTGSGSVTFANALLGDNAGRDCSITDSRNVFNGGSLDSDETCLRWRSSDRSTRELFIESLADNGGPTMTHALAVGSPALDAAVEDCPGVDQRGEPRPVGAGCDVGAFELGARTMSSTAAPALVTATPESSPTAEIAPEPPSVATDTLCWKGPGSAYEVVSSLAAGTEVQILGRGIQGGWWVVDNPRYPGVACWTPEEDLAVDPGFPLPEQIFEIPPLPTATPTEGPGEPEGCLYKGPNDPQPLCYPIDNCPVDFDDSEGACSP